MTIDEALALLEAASMLDASCESEAARYVGLAIAVPKLIAEVRLLRSRLADLGCSCAESMAYGWKENAHQSFCLLRLDRKLGES